MIFSYLFSEIIPEENNTKIINFEKKLISFWLEKIIKDIIKNKTPIAEAISQGICEPLIRRKILKIITDDKRQVDSSYSCDRNASWSKSDNILIITYLSCEIHKFWPKFGSFSHFYSLLKKVATEKLRL